MKQENRDVELTFKKLGHFWLDSGLIGLVKMLEDVNTDLQISVSDDKFVIRGSKDNLQSSLEKAYDNLVSGYYNLSTKKQETDTSSYNFYYDSKNDEFITFPKRSSVGIASIIYNKQVTPSKKQIKWKIKDKGKIISIKTDKKNKNIPKWKGNKVGNLPCTVKQLLHRVQKYTSEIGIKIGPPSGLLVDGPNQVRPKVTIKIGAGASKGNCYLCGESSNLLEEIKETVFPLITGSSGVLSFNSQGGKPEKVCWKCSFLGKFVPVNGFYLSQGDNLFAYLPYSTSLEKMLDVFGPLHEAEYKDPDLYKNFDHPLGGYFQRPFEVTFAFLFTLYRKVLLHQRPEEDDAILDWGEMLNLTTSKAPLDFFVLHMESKGKTTMGKMAWPFRDSVYFFRLMNEVEQNGINMRKIMQLYVDFTQKDENKTLTRNRICERILKKQTILDLTETHVFRANLNYFKPLLDFLIIYESIVRKEDTMTKEEQEIAVTLGKRVGMAVGGEGKKGDLYSLRKTRTKTDFLEQLNRLQFKLGSSFTVPPGVYEGKLTDENFKEFKPFCMIPALNSYNAVQSKSQKGGQS